MKKLAIFVEGQTELLFVDKLVKELVSANQLRIDHYTASGKYKLFKMVKDASLSPVDATHYLQIVNCGSDENVKSYILERYELLSREGFLGVIGIRDVYPSVSRAHVESLRIGLRYGVKTSPVSVSFVLGVMEIESWFLAEHTHFQRIDPALTIQSIIKAVGFNPVTDDLMLREHPAQDLHDIYKIVRKAYTKRRANCERTLEALDFAAIYLQHGSRFPDFTALVGTIEKFCSL